MQFSRKYSYFLVFFEINCYTISKKGANMKFLKGLGVSILTLILFVSATSILFLLPLRGAVSKQNIKETITKVDIEKLIKCSRRCK